MNLLQSFVASPLAGAIGWTLLHSLWEGAAISGVLGAALLTWRSPRARYLAASAAMLAMLAAFGVTLVWMMPEGTHGIGTSGVSVFPAWNIPTGESSSITWEIELAAAVPWLAPLWLLGVLLVYFRRLAGCVSVRRLRRRGVCCTSGHWQKELARLRLRLRVSRPVSLLESCLAEVPVVLGHFRPLILMPAGLLAGLPSGQIEAILLHELAHIRRHDYLANLLQRFIEGLFFYHPAVWWLTRIIRAERENCCDDIVVSVRGNPHEYALALAALEENRLSGRAQAVAVTGGNLMKRIRRLLYPKPSSALAPFLAATMFIATAVVSLAAWQAKPHQNSSAAAQSAAARTLETVNTHWIDGPASYIMTPKERLAFLRLKADEERHEFIKQFWKRRNPNPGSPENAFKEEFYRRVAYANEHFASDIPGWRTDRGRVYILWGPPNEIEDHDSGGVYRANPGELPPECRGATITYPFDDWYYNYIPGVGENVKREFVDPTGSGKYRLAMNPCDKFGGVSVGPEPR